MEELIKRAEKEKIDVEKLSILGLLKRSSKWD
ncbi:hypothetical protein Stok01_00738 [Sulfurisphaera tokodaii]